jgi:hypothetical protein
MILPRFAIKTIAGNATKLSRWGTTCAAISVTSNGDQGSLPALSGPASHPILEFNGSQFLEMFKISSEMSGLRSFNMSMGATLSVRFKAMGASTLPQGIVDIVADDGSDMRYQLRMSREGNNTLCSAQPRDVLTNGISAVLPLEYTLTAAINMTSYQTVTCVLEVFPGMSRFLVRVSSRVLSRATPCASVIYFGIF